MALRLRNIVKKILDQIGRRKQQQPTEEIYERCVVCGELTNVRIDTPIEFRITTKLEQDKSAATVIIK